MSWLPAFMGPYVILYNVVSAEVRLNASVATSLQDLATSSSAKGTGHNLL